MDGDYRIFGAGNGAVGGAGDQGALTGSELSPSGFVKALRKAENWHHMRPVPCDDGIAFYSG